MNIARLTQVRRLFPAEHYTPHLRRAYMRKWVISVRALEDRWLLAQPQPRRASREPAPISTAAAMLRQWRSRP